ncbi:MAG: DNA topoisomerase I [Nitrososphaerota archaeon]|nr:DNA topoisomerase I [Nitrososphaerota archaeon]
MGSRRYWTTLRSNGVALPPPYVPKGLRIVVAGRQVPLSPLAEEMAYAWAKKKDTQYVGDPVFVSNFMKDFSKELPEPLRGVGYDQLDFREFYEEVDREKRAKENATKEEKKLLAQQRKKQREELKDRYGYAWADGERMEIANWLVEPAGIFMGRGAHPFRGRWKPRVEAGDITLNLDEKTEVPEGSWGEVMHDHGSMWLARWTDKLTGKMKYVWPHDSSSLQQEKNREKYDNAMKLETRIHRIRKAIERGLASRDPKTRKMATVCYLIDKLGMRVGDEKDADEADTVGATTLRVEHVHVSGTTMEFDFLGKDSVRWNKTIENAEPAVLDNFRRFSAGKGPQDQIFDGITSRTVNGFLSGVAPNITAKVFRTYQATKTVQEFLERHTHDRLPEADENEKLYYARRANLEAAVVCNHKRTPPKNWEESLNRKKELLKEIEAREGRTDKEKHRIAQRTSKLKLQLDLAVRTRDYNLNTSLKNYIDPRTFRSWCAYVDLDWKKLYTGTLQRKFEWASRSRQPWNSADLGQAPRIRAT